MITGAARIIVAKKQEKEKDKKYNIRLSPGNARLSPGTKVKKFNGHKISNSEIELSRHGKTSTSSCISEVKLDNCRQMSRHTSSDTENSARYAVHKKSNSHKPHLREPNREPHHQEPHQREPNERSECINDKKIHLEVSPANSRKMRNSSVMSFVQLGMEALNRDLPHQSGIHDFYYKDSTQIFVAFLIFLNFVCSVLRATGLNGKNEDSKIAFKVIEILFCILFTIELCINLWANWFIQFWYDSWNVFDFIIVLISNLSLSLEALPGFGILRVFRAFRVFRLFKRIDSLRSIVEGVIKSLPGVLHAFGILVLIMSIWAIMGVELFDSDVYFKSFFPAVFTMFQIVTLDNWSEIARELIVEQSLTATIFFITYVFLGSIVMINVVIAVLLENFLNRTSTDEEFSSSYDTSELFDANPPYADTPNSPIGKKSSKNAWSNNNNNQNNVARNMDFNDNTEEPTIINNNNNSIQEDKYTILTSNDINIHTQNIQTKTTTINSPLSPTSPTNSNILSNILCQLIELNNKSDIMDQRFKAIEKKLMKIERYQDKHSRKKSATTLHGSPNYRHTKAHNSTGVISRKNTCQ